MKEFYRNGFTVIELIIFTAIFLSASIMFLSTLLWFSQIQVRQSAMAQVNQESLSLLQTIQRYIESASVVEEAGADRLKLRMSAASDDPVYIVRNETTAYIGHTAIFNVDTFQPLTSGRVKVEQLSFSTTSNAVAAIPATAHNAVSVSFLMSYNSANQHQQFSKALQTAVSRANAAQFEVGVFPETGGNLPLGTEGLSWKSINDAIYFSAPPPGWTGPSTKWVGIGSAQIPSYPVDIQVTTTSITGTLQIIGSSAGLLLGPATANIVCDSSRRGMFRFNGAGSNASDTIEVCIKNNVENYQWKKVTN